MISNNIMPAFGLLGTEKRIENGPERAPLQASSRHEKWSNCAIFYLCKYNKPINVGFMIEKELALCL